MIKIDKRGHAEGGENPTEVMVELAKSLTSVKAAAASGVTDNSGGTAGSTVSNVAADAADEAASGTDLAQAAATAAAVVTVENALATLFASANAVATAIGVSTIADNTGGVDGSGTVAAVTVAVTGAAVGITAAEWNEVVGEINNATKALAVLVNRLSEATGWAPDTIDSALPALATTVEIGVVAGAGDPGVKKAVVDADLTVMRTNVATIAASLNQVTSVQVATVVVAG